MDVEQDGMVTVKSTTGRHTASIRIQKSASLMNGSAGATTVGSAGSARSGGNPVGNGPGV